MNERKQYNSDICIDGKRIGAMRLIAEMAFEESFLSIEVKMPERIFEIRIEDNVSARKLKEFMEKHKLCRIIPFKRIPLSDLIKKDRLRNS